MLNKKKNNHNYKKQKDYRQAQDRKKRGVEKEMAIKVIRLGELENPFEHFDSPVVPLTEEQTEAIDEFCDDVIFEARNLEREISQVVVDYNGIIDILETLHRQAIYLRDIIKNQYD